VATETQKIESGREHKEIEFTIDGKPYETESKELTAQGILGLVDKEPSGYYLVEIRGKKERFSYKDSPETIVKLHQGSKFITVSTGETPVS
jgi:hypothetical protein